MAYEISNLIRYSLKLNAAFHLIKTEQPAEDEGSRVGIRAFCHTRWTVRGDAIESILENYNTLQQLWDDCMDMRLDPYVKGRIIGVKSQMVQCNLFFGLHLCKTVLKITDNLSRTLQKQRMSAAAGQSVADLTVATLKQMRSDEWFRLFYDLVDTNRQKAGVDDPILTRKRKAPHWFEIGSSDGFHSPTVEDCYRYKHLKPSMHPFLASPIGSISQGMQSTGTGKNCLLMQ